MGMMYLKQVSSIAYQVCYKVCWCKFCLLYIVLVYMRKGSTSLWNCRDCKAGEGFCTSQILRSLSAISAMQCVGCKCTIFYGKKILKLSSESQKDCILFFSIILTTFLRSNELHFTFYFVLQLTYIQGGRQRGRRVARATPIFQVLFHKTLSPQTPKP